MTRPRTIFCNRYFHPDHSATSQMLSDLAIGLANANFDVHVVTSRQRYDDPLAELPAREMIDGVGVHRVRTTRFGRDRLAGRALDYLSYYVAATFVLLRLVRSGDVLVAKTDPPLVSVPATWVARWRGARLVNWLQDLFPEVAVALDLRGFRGALGRWLMGVRNGSLRSAAVNVVIGERMCERLLSLGLPPGNIRVIHNWADGAAIRPCGENRDAGLRDVWGLTGKFVVGYSGNMGRAHEFATILDTAESLKDAESIAFLFIGGGPCHAWIQGEIQRRTLRNVYFQPYQPRERLGDSMCVADVHLISLRPQLEGLIVPSKFYGIASAGLPTLYVGDPDGEVGRLVGEARCGFAVRPGESGRLAEYISELAADPKRVSEMGANARALFEERFGKSIAMAKWRAVLDEAVEAKVDGLAQDR